MHQTEFTFIPSGSPVKKKRVRTSAQLARIKARKREKYLANAEAVKAAAKAYRLANPDKIRERNRNYEKRNKDKVAEWSKKSRQKNAERCKEYAAQYYRENREHHYARVSAWAKRNPEKIAEYSRKKRERDPVATAAREKAWRDAAPERVSMQQRRRRMKKMTNSTMEEIRMADKKILAMRSGEFSNCSYCDRRMESKAMHVDHIFPINKGGGHTPENIQISCKNCNSQKSDKILYVEWVPPKDRAFRPASEDLETTNEET